MQRKISLFYSQTKVASKLLMTRETQGDSKHDFGVGVCSSFVLLSALVWLTVQAIPSTAIAQTSAGLILADLTVVGEIFRAQDYIFPGNVGQYSAEIKNIGSKRADNARVVMKFNQSDQCTHYVSLDPGKSQYVWCGYSADLAGELHADVVIDGQGSIQEIVETNNHMYTRFLVSPPQQRSDIAVGQYVSHEPVEIHSGDDVLFTAVVFNKNKWPTGWFSLKWLLDQDKEPACRETLELAAEESRTVACLVKDLAKTGSLRLIVTADESGRVFETYEDNNSAEAEYAIASKRAVPYEYVPAPAAPVEQTAEESTPVVLGEADTVETPPVVIAPTFESQARALLDGLLDGGNEQLEADLREKFKVSLLADLPPLVSPAENTLFDFMAYGVDQHTWKLGAGERAAVLFSYKDAYGKLPATVAEFADVLRIANGRWPVELNLAAQDRAHQVFYEIYQHVADMSDPHENAAITIMTYGLKQRGENRNLTSEKAGIKTFKAIFGRQPSTTREWNTMQAITYSGASR